MTCGPAKQVTDQWRGEDDPERDVLGERCGLPDTDMLSWSDNTSCKEDQDSRRLAAEPKKTADKGEGEPRPDPIDGLVDESRFRAGINDCPAGGSGLDPKDQALSSERDHEVGYDHRADQYERSAAHKHPS